MGHFTHNKGTNFQGAGRVLTLLYSFFSWMLQLRLLSGIQWQYSHQGNEVVSWGKDFLRTPRHSGYRYFPQRALLEENDSLPLHCPEAFTRIMRPVIHFLRQTGGWGLPVNHGSLDVVPPRAVWSQDGSFPPWFQLLYCTKDSQKYIKYCPNITFPCKQLLLLPRGS